MGEVRKREKEGGEKSKRERELPFYASPLSCS